MSVKTCYTLLAVFFAGICIGLVRVGWHTVMHY